MLKYLSIIFSFTFCVNANSQDVNELIRTADKNTTEGKNAAAIANYKSILQTQPNNKTITVKLIEALSRLGDETQDENYKKFYYNEAYQTASNFFKQDSSKPEAYYVIAMTSGNLTKVETDKKKLVGYVKDTKVYADRGLKLQPNNSKLLFIEGNWHFEVYTLNWAKKLAVKALYGGLPEGNLDSAINYLERSKLADPYFALNMLVLAKAYNENNQPTKYIETLKQTVKLPELNSTDKTAKMQAKKLLDSDQ